MSFRISKTGAKFDVTGQYRYLLWREWDDTLPKIGFIMLNPNRADALSDDPTIRRCLRFARSWGYGSLEVANLFAYRTASPKSLRQVIDPIGNENDQILQTLGQHVDCLLLAWGNWGTLQQRHQAVLKLLEGYPLYCLGFTKQRQPCHPLYLKSSLHPVEFH